MRDMQRLVRTAMAVGAALFLAVSGAGSAERSITLLPGTDLPGFDYSTLKDTDLDSCSATCTEDKLCQAFTFNEKAGWCFLKGAAGTETPFTGATSGRVEQSPTLEELAATREAELPFPSSDLVYSARYFAEQLPTTDTPPEGIAYSDLVANGDAAMTQQNAAGAMVSYRQALAINANDPELWLKLADAANIRGDEEAARGNGTYELGSVSNSAAIMAFLKAEGVDLRARALSALAHGLEFRQMWRESIASYRASVALIADATVQAALDKVVAENGFRVVSNSVDPDAATPRICVDFAFPLATGTADYSQYVVVDGAPAPAVETDYAQLCITGLEHGKRYSVKLRAGLPSQDGDTLLSDVDLNLYVPDRAPFVGFANNAYVLPAGLGGGLPITSVNAELADVVIYRIGDRGIATAVRNGIFQRALDGYSAEDVANRSGEKAWEGQVELAKAAPNALATTTIPVTEALGAIQPGAYVVTAKVTGSNEDYWREMATQWFIVTDLGLTTVQGDDGVHIFVRGLTGADPVNGAKVRLIAVNNEILGETTTDAEGHAVFAPGLARGEGGRAPQLVTAETATGDYAFLDLTRPAFDLTDRGVEGRPSPGALDLFATTERGVYRPGETVFLDAILRDARAEAVLDLPLTVEFERPDGVVAETLRIEDQGAGGYHTEVPLTAEAMRGSWSIRLYADPESAPLSSLTFLVEDFEPERLAFEITGNDKPVVVDEVTPIAVAAKYLYGATAPGLDVEADVVLRPTTTLPGFAGYVFGREDDTVETSREPLGVVGTTDDTGAATADVVVPARNFGTKPFEAQLILRLIDSNGRAVERSLTRSVMAAGNRIGIKPQFGASGDLAEGSEASFDVIAVAPDGKQTDQAGLTWRLSRVETNYQWYRDGGAWRWEAITSTNEVASGTVDAAASGPVSIAAPVTWGRYLVEVESSGPDATSTSYEFYAGYYYVDAGSDTPDTLKVALDKPAYQVGDTAQLKLEPQFAGTALVMVVDNRVIDMIAVPVPAEGTTIPLTVSEAWGPGAYVTAMLYRPGSVAEKRMPARALGLAFADVDPGDRKLDVSIAAPADTLPRQGFDAEVTIANLTPGETAYVTVAAVDLGILNLTNFKTPDPDGWFYGQRQLGMEIRDLYGLLIDPLQGMPGALRSGGDGESSRLGTPPAITVLVAQHSGIVTVGADGKATVSFDMPDFAGTVRLMAMAWTPTSVGHAQADVIVRDPVVVTLSPPRFLRLDDTSRLLVEIANISGAAGPYKVSLATGEGLSTDAAEQTIEIAQGGRAALDLSLTGTALGDQELKLIVEGPDGKAQVKNLTLGVRAASAPVTVTKLVPLAPGESTTIDASYFADMVPHTGSLTLAVGPISRLNVPELLLSLDRYPYGCAEQVSSRALPLLYLNDVANMLGMGSDDALDQRVKDAIANLLAKQNSAGGFGLWGPFSGSDMWLDSYVTDFLQRAVAKGYTVPDLAMSMALDNLSNQLSYASDFTMGGEDVAYALYVLSRAGRAAIGDLRYYLEARLDNFGSPLAKAQLGAALALYGDRTRAETAFAAAVAGLGNEEERYRYRIDYGSRLRDTAAVLALAAEFKPSEVDVASLATELSKLRDEASWTSTQEDAATLLAAAALGSEAQIGSVTIDGEAIDGSAYRRYDQELIEGGGITVTNTGNQPTEIAVSVNAIPSTAPEASENGFSLSSSMYMPDGSEVDLDNIRQNDRFVVVIEATASQLGSGQYVIADPLPAGFEIENPNLLAGSGVADLSWLTLDQPAHVESRTDQFVAAFRYFSEKGTFKTAYMVRAVSPGTFVWPGTTVEDMYRPELRANTGSGSIEVAPAGK